MPAGLGLEMPKQLKVDGGSEHGSIQLSLSQLKHSQRKRGETDRPDLQGTAPALDPTGDFERRHLPQDRLIHVYPISPPDYRQM